MIQRITAIAVLAASFVYAAAAEPNESSLLEADRAWARAAVAGDLEKVFSFWADTAQIYAPGLPPAIGIEQVREFVKKRRSLPGSSISWEPQVAEVSGAGDMGYTRGTYQMTLPTPGGSSTSLRGTYVSIWRYSQELGWKCSLEIHSPLPPAEARGPR